MVSTSFRARVGLLAGAALLAALPPALAQGSFPTHPLKLVVPYTPGGAADVLGRAVADRMGRTLGQPVIIENRPGAGGAIAAEYVAKSPADGYTLLLAGTTALVLYPLLNAGKPAYDAQKDFAGVGMMAFSPLVMVVDAKAPAGTAPAFAMGAKAHPGTVNFGSSGNGSAMHIVGALYSTVAGLDLTHVPYKGSPPALNGLMSGEVQTVFDLVASAKPLIDGGKLKALAVTSARRSSVLPEVPTLQEQGYKDFDFAVRYALVAPGATPHAVVERLNKELNAAIGDPAVAAQLKNLALDVMPGPAGAVMAFAAKERARLGPVIKANNITLDP
jgi:tripartite-type tricarboxylate transporter receptor subunit TctC